MFTRFSSRSTLFVLSLCATAAGCTQVEQNPNDSTPPSIEIDVEQGGQYVPLDTVSLGAEATGPLKLICHVRDLDGVKSVAVSFSSGADACNVHGSVFSGSFTITPVPNTAAFQSSPSSVYTELPMQAQLQGPFSCNVPGQGTGVPYGQQIKVTCTGSNWSADAAKATAQKLLTVTLQ